MIDHILIALVCAAAVGVAWDYGRRKLQFEHGRLLTADKTSHLERNLDLLRVATRTDIATIREEIAQLFHAAQQDAVKLKALESQSNDAPFIAHMAASKAWQTTCEQSVLMLQAELEKHGRAVVNVAEEVQKLQEREALALAGVANVPKAGFRRT